MKHLLLSTIMCLFIKWSYCQIKTGASQKYVVLLFMNQFSNDTLSLIYNGKLKDTLILNTNNSLSMARSYQFFFKKEMPKFVVYVKNRNTAIQIEPGYSYCYIYNNNGIIKFRFSNQFNFLE